MQYKYMKSLCRAIPLKGERIQKLQFLSVVFTNVARSSQSEHSSARFCFRTLLAELSFGFGSSYAKDTYLQLKDG